MVSRDSSLISTTKILSFRHIHQEFISILKKFPKQFKNVFPIIAKPFIVKAHKAYLKPVPIFICLERLPKQLLRKQYTVSRKLDRRSKNWFLFRSVHQPRIAEILRQRKKSVEYFLLYRRFFGVCNERWGRVGNISRYF